MNDETEMSLDSAQDSAAVEASENAAEGGEQSAGADVESAAEQESADKETGAEGENEVPEPGTESEDDDDFDDYDGFYHDMSDFEDEDDSEGGDTTTDPESEDGDDGENEGEEQPESDEDGDGAEGEASEDAENTEDAEDGGGDDAGDNAEQEGQGETEAAEGGTEQAEPPETAGGAADFSSWEQQDRAAILKAHPELEGLLKGKHLSEVLDDPDLFGYLRGSAASRAKYSAVEAFEMASAKLLATRAANAKAKQSSKQHINSSNGKAATANGAIPEDAYRRLRHEFPNKTRAEIENLYKRITT